MLEIKVSATFLLPGSTLVAEKPISKTGKSKEQLEQLKQEYYRTHKQETVAFYCNRQRHIIEIWTRVGKPATQKINLCKEAYDYMISSEGYVGIVPKHDWSRTSKKMRVKLHLMQIAESLGGSLLDFAILED